MIKLYPTILTDSARLVQDQLNLSNQFSEISTAQIDVIDGQFADNVTITPSDLRGMDFGRLRLDFHLLTEEPLDYVVEAVVLKDELPIRSFIGQIERMSSQRDFIQEVKSHGWKAGLALDFFTPVDEINTHAWEKIDSLLLMSVEAGFQGKELKEQIFNKIEQVKKIIELQDHPIELIVDGGINQSNYKKIIKAGATGLAVGSALWFCDNIQSAVEGFLS